MAATISHCVTSSTALMGYSPLTVLVALMDGVDAQISGQALRLWFAPLADGNHRGPGWLITGVALR